MRYFALIPSFIYFAFIVMSIGLYLNQGYLIQVTTIKVLYSISFFGILAHGYEGFAFLKQTKTPSWYQKMVLPVDAILIMAVIFIVPSGQMIALYFALLYNLYVGVTHGKSVGYAFAFLFFSSISLILFIQVDVNSAPLLLNIIIVGSSFFIVNIIANLIVTVFDDHKQENLKLQRLNTAILDNAPIGLLVTNELGSIVAMNPVSQSIFRTLDSAFDLKLTETVTQTLPELRSLDPADKNGVTIIRKIADLFLFLKVKVVTLPFADLADTLFLYVIEDRTEVEKAEMAKRQSEKLAAIGTLAAGIAHEIRNPLTGMSGALQLLEPNLDSDESKKLTRIVFREIDRLNGLITEFLDYSKPELIPPDEPINLTRVLEESISVVKQDSRFPFLEDLTLEKTENVMMIAYPDKLKQIFLNILVNSAQALESSEKKELRVVLGTEPDAIRIRFIDSGIGMTPETKIKVFEPFHTTKPKGTGLGMAIVLKLIEMHRGQIFVESELGIGTTIEIRFPRSVI